MNPIYYLLLISGALTAFSAYKFIQKKRFERQPFPPEWAAIMVANIPVYRRLPDSLKLQLQRLVKRFIRDKQFHGCADLTITDEMRVTIAAEACLLILNRPTNEFYQLHHILVYPHSYVAKHEQQSEAGVISEQQTGRSGESWNLGKVILSWDDVVKGSRNFTDGHNVVLHEFAHQLDQESGSANGAPLLGPNSSYQRWATVLSHDFERLKKGHRRGFKSVLDTYGATNPAEFFAVATETFFEKPDALKKKHLELYRELRTFYAVDPIRWHKGS